MSFTKSYITREGAALISAILIDEKKLEITSVVGGKSQNGGLSASEIDEIKDVAFEFKTVMGFEWIEPSTLKIPIYYENSELSETVGLTEIALFAKDRDGVEKLLAISTSYDEPLYIPPISEGRLEMTCECYIEVSLSPNIEISLPSSTIFLTRPEAMKLFWKIGEKYPASEITESIGKTAEMHQRWQDEELKRIWSIIESGSTAGTMIERGTGKPLMWKIVGDNGYYDEARGTFRA